MALKPDDRRALEELDFRLRVVLPEEYQALTTNVQPVSMGSAGLKYDAQGQVAWDQVWGSFCDLAMAGGPPHKGTLLEPGSPADCEAQRDRYEAVVAEICRGVRMSTGLPADPSPNPGWIRVECDTAVMAGWLLRAIVMENIAVRADGTSLDLPAAPAFRLEKEIKNVVTVVAKTCHYWSGHMPRAQHRAIASLFDAIGAEAPLVEPGFGAHEIAPATGAVAARIAGDTGFRMSPHQYTGWLGVECASVRAAIWIMRALVVSNVLSRREETILFLPVNKVADPDGARVSGALTRIGHLAAVDGVV